MKVYIRNRQRLIKVNPQKVSRLLRKILSLLRLPRTEISILFVNDRRMRLLNRQYRGIDRTTDVLSFPQYGPEELKAEVRRLSHKCTSDLQSSSEMLPLGDLVMNLHRAERQALEHNLSFDEEFRRLLVHGMLHLAGYDHEQGSSAARSMQKKSRELLLKLR